MQHDSSCLIVIYDVSISDMYYILRLDNDGCFFMVFRM